MARLTNLIFVTTLGALLGAGTLASCTVNESTDDGDSGESGAAQGGGTQGGAGGTNGGQGGSVAGGGGSGESGASGAGEGGGSGESGASGAAGAAGAAGNGDGDGKVCTAPTAENATGAGWNCAEYCAAFFDTCPTFASVAAFASEAECRQSCEFFDNTALCCRADHVQRAAAGSTALHCPHAAGEAPCN